MINYKQILPQSDTLSGELGLVIINIRNKEILLTYSDDTQMWHIPQISANANNAYAMPSVSEVSKVVDVDENKLSPAELDSCLQRRNECYYCYGYEEDAESVCDNNHKWIGIYDTELTSSKDYSYILELFYCFVLQRYSSDANVDEDFNKKRTYYVTSMLLKLYMKNGVNEDYIYSVYSAIKQMADGNEYAESNYWEFKLAIAEYIKDANNSELILKDILSDAMTYIHQISREEVILDLCGKLLALYKNLDRKDDVYRLLIEMTSFFDALGSYIKLRYDVLDMFSEYIAAEQDIASFKATLSDSVRLLSPRGDGYALLADVYTKFVAENSYYNIVSCYYRLAIIQIIKQYRKFKLYEMTDTYFKDKEIYCLDKVIPLCNKLSMLYAQNRLWQKEQSIMRFRYDMANFIADEQKLMLKISDAEHYIMVARWSVDKKDYNSAYDNFIKAADIYKSMRSYRYACNALHEALDSNCCIGDYAEAVKQEISRLESMI